MAREAKYYATVNSSVMGRLNEIHESIEATLQEEIEREKEKMQKGGTKV